MLAFILKRLTHSVFVVFMVSVIVFGIIQTTPGDPIALMLGSQATPEMVELLREQMGLNRPIVAQYLSWAAGVLRGDFGTALRDGVAVLPALVARLPATIILLTVSIVIAVLLGVPFGIVAAVKRDTIWDALSRFAIVLAWRDPHFRFRLSAEMASGFGL